MSSHESSSAVERTAGRAHWRSLEELAATPQFQEMVAREFPSEASVLKDGHSRRGFLQVMGASLSLAGLTGCRWPQEKILPFAHRPEGRVPGEPDFFATAFDLSGSAQGLVVTSYDGRPIKVEGNPDHPSNLGAADVFSQALILEMYDPDRSQNFLRAEGRQSFNTNWDEFLDGAGRRFAEHRASGGQGLWILSEPSSSPALRSQRRMVAELMPRATWVEWEPLSRMAEVEGARIAFGRPLRVVPRFEAAEFILALDSDFLSDHPSALRNARGFARGRRPEQGHMSRLHVVESCPTVTGSSADARHIVPGSAIGIVAGRIAAELAAGSGLPAMRAAGLEWFSHHAYQAPFVSGLVAELRANAGRSLVIAGPRQPAEVHALVHLINAALGNFGAAGSAPGSLSADPSGSTGGAPAGTPTLRLVEDPSVLLSPDSRSSGGPAAPLASLCEAMRSGAVETLLIVGGNPVYDAPSDLAFADALQRVPYRVHLGLYNDETARACLDAPGAMAWHLPRAHALETWGDARAWDGTYSVVQPLIAPLYGGRTATEVLAVALGHPATAHDLAAQSLQEFARGLGWNGVFEDLWHEVLRDGHLRGSALPEAAPELSPALPAALQAWRPAGPQLGRDALEMEFTRDARVYDGRFANNGWLQEFPDPLTKITWDNAVLLAPSTASTLGVKTNDVVTLRLGGRGVEATVYVMPGQAAMTAALSLGYGRQAAGRVGDQRGTNAYALRSSEALYFAGGLSIERTGRSHALACTQAHHAIDAVGRGQIEKRVGVLAREGSLEEYQHHPEFARHLVHHPPLKSLWQEPEYEGHAWGMSIDLTACIGCGACMVACVAENNIPVVGPDRVRDGREMHWIRVDRYFVGDEEAPEVVHQPVACVHCENAPCEQVCPVGATMHDQDGLNVMAYNRCIGTRYCSNNCPYKVRRFNFFNYRKELTPQQKMAANPDVTPRSRGVMEKCTYCTQRITATKIKAKNERRPIRDGEVVPACAQTCPTEAIIFGDLKDPQSRVRQEHEKPRSYGLLAELNTQPRTLYLAKIRNTPGGGGHGSGQEPAGGHGHTPAGGDHTPAGGDRTPAGGEHTPAGGEHGHAPASDGSTAPGHGGSGHGPGGTEG